MSRARFFTAWILAALTVFPAAFAAEAAESGGEADAPAVGVRLAPPNRVFEARMPGFESVDYHQAIESLFAAYERDSGRSLRPGPRGRVGLKVYSDSGPGLSTRPDLVRAVVAALERRGFARSGIFLVGLNAARLRASGFIPPLSVGGETFEGLPVLVLESGRHYDPEWYYDSPLPSRLEPTGSDDAETPADLASDRRSYLPLPLLFSVDFWLNLPMCSDHPVLGVNAALVNATLWNASNTQRFFRSPATAPAAVAEMAAIPELRDSWALTLLSLERYQFIGGPVFNSLYTVSEPMVWLSENPVILDSLMRERIDRARRAAGFRGLPEDLRLIAYAEALGLGSGNRVKTRWVRVDDGAR